MLEQPTDLDELDDPLAATRRRWFVLHVKPRTEKKTARYLLKYRCFCHLPCYRKVTKVQRRKVVYDIPLFPGYVFSRLNPDERVKMLQTNLIVRTIQIPNPRQTIHELRQIARAARSGAPLNAIKQVFKEGERVRVTRGYMRGVEGYVKYTSKGATLCLNVEILGSSVELSIAPFDVERIKP